MFAYKGKTYPTVFLDFDGVIADTNPVKERHIRQSVEKYAETEQADAFVQYFMENSGIPREKKVLSRFDRDTGLAILQDYNRRNMQAFSTMELTEGCDAFLEQCRRTGTALHVLSGGDEAEIRHILQHNGPSRFDSILSGPETKAEHLSRLDFRKPALFIGDSRYDHQVALSYGLDFVFMSGYTRFNGWQVYFQESQSHQIVSNFKEML